MASKTFFKVSALTILILISFAYTQNSMDNKHANIVYILADDMGYGDVHILNKDSKIPTPNIDRLGNEGIIFTDAHSGSAVCTPTRYGILTGRYAWRAKLKEQVLFGYADHLIEDGRETVLSIHDPWPERSHRVLPKNVAGTLQCALRYRPRLLSCRTSGLLQKTEIQ